ncbi:orexin receptor type 2-like [Actinia tenebrosa]|uniref:Orexin receptor type 2-like n=1 Tax=Actinia tenebrosa TaxID=6105 RepID=A0A6P8I9S7_ACTTE|nr:orexin receptor type 2-like [Actinia tenebrosa]
MDGLENSSLFNASKSLAGPEHKSFIKEPFPITVLRLVLFGVIFLTALIGNIVVLTAPWRNKRLQTFSYSLISCLALGDLISTLGLPFTLATEQLHSNWIFGELLCQILNPTQVVCGMVTTNVHTAIAIDRFVSTAYPFKGKPKGTVTWLMLVIIWLSAILCSLPAYITRRLETLTMKNGRDLHLCVEVFPALRYQNVYSVFLFLVNYAMPIILMGILYTKVVILLRKTKQNRRISVYHTTRKTGSSGGAHRQEIFLSNTRVERKFIRMVFIVMIVFVLCYLPYQVMFLLMDFKVATESEYTFILFDYAYFITWIPNALNPICYGAMDRFYASAFVKLFAFFRRRKKGKESRIKEHEKV